MMSKLEAVAYFKWYRAYTININFTATKMYLLPESMQNCVQSCLTNLLLHMIPTSILPMSTFLYSFFISFTPSFIASTVVFVSFSCWVAKLACSMLND